jgi:hypothetical protein
LDWEPKLVKISFFEAKGASKVNLVGQLQVLFKEYKLINKIICYAKYEGINLSIMTDVLKQIITYEELAMHAPFEGVCFVHDLFKACQYATSDGKVSSGLQLMNIKTPQSSIRSYTTWPKKSSKRRIECMKACLTIGL